MIEVSGGCHCGAIRFTATLPQPPVPALACNCSICSMTGFLHVMVPHDRFELLTGRDRLTSYRFGTGAADHLFCGNCGVKSFYVPRSKPDGYSVNLRCLDDGQVRVTSISLFDGQHWEEAFAASRGKV